MLDDLMLPVTEEKLPLGTVLRRRGNGKDQQGCLMRYDEENNFILVNVIDLLEQTLLAREGILRPQEGDSIFYYTTSFRNNPRADEALEVVTGWPIYRKHEDLQKSILNFVRISYVPEQILAMKKQDALQLLFVPIQQMFRIGRFTEKRNWDRVGLDRFKTWLEALQEGDHITYIAQVLEHKSFIPKFYSAGTQPHQVTVKLLDNEPFAFNATHGGHIKAMKPEGGKKQFLVDAGSTHLGRGVKTPLSTTKMITGALSKTFPEFSFTPVEGRGAFGTQQSY